jgi:hypothetical protein
VELRHAGERFAAKASLHVCVGVGGGGRGDGGAGCGNRAQNTQLERS